MQESQLIPTDAHWVYPELCAGVRENYNLEGDQPGLGPGNCEDSGPEASSAGWSTSSKEEGRVTMVIQGPVYQREVRLFLVEAEYSQEKELWNSCMAVSGSKPIGVLRSHLAFSSQDKRMFSSHNLANAGMGLLLHEFPIVQFCYSRQPLRPSLLTGLETATAHGAC